MSSDAVERRSPYKGWNKEQRAVMQLAVWKWRLAGVEVTAMPALLEKEFGASVSTSNCYLWISKQLKITTQETRDQLRDLEMQRLNKLQLAADELLASDHPRAKADGIAAALRVQESRRKMLGLDDEAAQDKPEKSEAEKALSRLLRDIYADKRTEEAQIREGADRDLESGDGSGADDHA